MATLTDTVNSLPSQCPPHATLHHSFLEHYGSECLTSFAQNFIYPHTLIGTDT